jgi:hypothetical protein
MQVLGLVGKWFVIFWAFLVVSVHMERGILGTNSGLGAGVALVAVVGLIAWNVSQKLRMRHSQGQ